MQSRVCAYEGMEARGGVIRIVCPSGSSMNLSGLLPEGFLEGRRYRARAGHLSVPGLPAAGEGRFRLFAVQLLCPPWRRSSRCPLLMFDTKEGHCHTAEAGRSSGFVAKLWGFAVSTVSVRLRGPWPFTERAEAGSTGRVRWMCLGLLLAPQKGPRAPAAAPVPSLPSPPPVAADVPARPGAVAAGRGAGWPHR